MPIRRTDSGWEYFTGDDAEPGEVEAEHLSEDEQLLRLLDEVVRLLGERQGCSAT